MVLEKKGQHGREMVSQGKGVTWKEGGISKERSYMEGSGVFRKVGSMVKRWSLKERVGWGVRW